jgi:hypothetical protein
MRKWHRQERKSAGRRQELTFHSNYSLILFRLMICCVPFKGNPSSRRPIVTHHKVIHFPLVWWRKCHLKLISPQIVHIWWFGQSKGLLIG